MIRTPEHKQMILFDQNKSETKTISKETGFLSFPQEPGWPDEFGESLTRWADEKLENRIKTLSIFSGAGGLDIGFHNSGYDIKAMVEIDPRFVETLQANSGKGRYLKKADIICTDIRDYNPPKDLSIDFIIGGPPCQTFSAAGRRAAGVCGTSDKRGTLFEEYVRLLRILKPKGFLFENVYGITGAENGSAWNKIQAAFAEVGYKISYRILDSADYGVPQHRERLFVVGVKENEYLFPCPTHGPDSLGHRPFYTAFEAISDLNTDNCKGSKGLGGKFGHLLDGIPPGLNYSFYTEKMGHPEPVFAWRSKFSDFLYKADPDSPTRTLKAQGGQYTGPFHWENRPFSVDELKRLQTIPDRYGVNGGRQVAIHQIGNSVPPQLARILSLSILSQVFGVMLPFELPLLKPNHTLGFRKRKRLLTNVYRKKVEAAIKKLKHTHPKSQPSNRCYRAILKDNFEWIETNETKALLVDFEASDKEWIFLVSRDRKRKKPRFSITITPAADKAWTLQTKQVILFGTYLDRDVFTGAWKAFEAELVKAGLKADLVQLCGYYQYRPAIQAKMTMDSGNTVRKEWKILQHIVNGTGIRSLLSNPELSVLWDVSGKAVLGYAQFLRQLGYEIRNENTNPTIPKGHFLIPYSFPTFTSQSVQLKKSLEKKYEGSR